MSSVFLQGVINGPLDFSSHPATLAASVRQLVVFVLNVLDVAKIGAREMSCQGFSAFAGDCEIVNVENWLDWLRFSGLFFFSQSSL